MVSFKSGYIYCLIKCGVYQIYTNLYADYKNAEQLVLEACLVTTDKLATKKKSQFKHFC